MIVVGVRDGNGHYFGDLDDDVSLGFVVGAKLVFHVARVVVVGVADVDDFGDYYDDCVLGEKSDILFYRFFLDGWGEWDIPRPGSCSGNGFCGHCPWQSSSALQS